MAEGSWEESSFNLFPKLMLETASVSMAFSARQTALVNGISPFGLHFFLPLELNIFSALCGLVGPSGQVAKSGSVFGTRLL